MCSPQVSGSYTHTHFFVQHVWVAPHVRCQSADRFPSLSAPLPTVRRRCDVVEAQSAGDLEQGGAGETAGVAARDGRSRGQAGYRKEGEVGSARHASQESYVLRQAWRRDSERIEEEVLRQPRGMSVELEAVSDFVEMAAALARHACSRLACKPLRFEPTDTTRSI